jgi:anti-sigma factor RsiW
MTRPFSDELLSAFLDDELNSADREQVEQHLATSEADRLLVAELQRLRGDVAALPPARVSDDFTDRVLAAALAEAERTGMAIGALPVPDSAAADINKVEPNSASGSAASVLPEPGFTGILAADADTE